jgi:uncharacterized protein (DUF1684 family)
VTSPIDNGDDSDHSEFIAEWRAWHENWMAPLREPYGLLSMTAMHWLTATAQEFDGLPGCWQTNTEGIVVCACRDEGLLVDGQLVDGEVVLRKQRELLLSQIVFGAVLVDLLYFQASHGRPEQFAARLRDPLSPIRNSFTGIPAFPPDPKWVMPGRFEPYPVARPVTLDTAFDNVQKDLNIFGRIVFSLLGQEYAFEVYAGVPGELHVPFRDLTSGVSTYGGARILMVPLPDRIRPDGGFDLTLDFNRAVNGPCGLTPYAPCALPPPGNTLPVAIEAGEQSPPWRVAL